MPGKGQPYKKKITKTTKSGSKKMPMKKGMKKK